ncbi:c-type cytochrome [Dyella soli]|uniref:Cytochrome c n=1 Tax=Dyella soli TaxID=522319 RepID=A0A4R0YM82_9GAMM|nr:cytochrome c [Dyella soli]TCI09977.1 cytochrome c [Dyella soli]
MKRALTLLSFGAVLAFASTQLLAAGSIENGKQKAATCFACHGTDGNAVDPQYPRLAGQYNMYLQQALHEYKSGQRSNPIMKGFVATLSEQDIEDVAAYFSSQPTKLDTLQGHIQGDK